MAVGSLRRLFWPYLTGGDMDLVAEAVAEAEARTSGEIHVHLAGPINTRDPLVLARRKFFELELDKTKRRNGVIIFLSEFDHRFAIWGDEGIHKAAGQELWDHAAAALQARLKEGDHAQGLVDCVRLVGDALSKLFPKEGPDANELPDRPSRA